MQFGRAVPRVYEMYCLLIEEEKFELKIKKKLNLESS